MNMFSSYGYSYFTTADDGGYHQGAESMMEYATILKAAYYPVMEQNRTSIGCGAHAHLEDSAMPKLLYLSPKALRNATHISGIPIA